MTNYRRRKKPKKNNEKSYNLNKRIDGDEFRVIDEEGGMIGVLSRKEALALASEKEMDLIEINPKANPPVIKMMEFNKFKYQISKAQVGKPKTKEMKTMRVSVRVSDNDLAVKAVKVDEFLEKGIKVKLQVVMRGREKAHPEVASDVMQAFLNKVKIEFIYESEPKHEGANYISVIKPK